MTATQVTPLMTAAAPNSDGVLHNCNCYINSDGV